MAKHLTLAFGLVLSLQFAATACDAASGNAMQRSNAIRPTSRVQFAAPEICLAFAANKPPAEQINAPGAAARAAIQVRACAAKFRNDLASMSAAVTKAQSTFNDWAAAYALAHNLYKGDADASAFKSERDGNQTAQEAFSNMGDWVGNTGQWDGEKRGLLDKDAAALHAAVDYLKTAYPAGSWPTAYYKANSDIMTDQYAWIEWLRLGPYSTQEPSSYNWKIRADHVRCLTDWGSHEGCNYEAHYAAAIAVDFQKVQDEWASTKLRYQKYVDLLNGVNQLLEPLLSATAPG